MPFSTTTAIHFSASPGAKPSQIGFTPPRKLLEAHCEDNAVRAIDVLVDELDLAAPGFDGVEPQATGRPAYHPATLFKIYVYGYLNRVQSSRRLGGSVSATSSPKLLLTQASLGA